MSIELIKAIDNLCINEYNMIDKQDYLDWKDSLNAISIDPDRD